jgi:hypothetical protein
MTSIHNLILVTVSCALAGGYGAAMTHQSPRRKAQMVKSVVGHITLSSAQISALGRVTGVNTTRTSATAQIHFAATLYKQTIDGSVIFTLMPEPFDGQLQPLVQMTTAYRVNPRGIVSAASLP